MKFLETKFEDYVNSCEKKFASRIRKIRKY